MRFLRFLIFIIMCATIGFSDTSNTARERFVVVEFTDEHVSLFILGENDLSQFQINGTNLRVVADCSKHTLQVSGTGEVIYKTHRLAFSKGTITVNGKALPAEARNFVLSPNGEVREGFVRNFDRSPHKN